MERIELNLIPIEHRVSKRDHTWMLDKKVIIPTVFLLVEMVIIGIMWLTVSETNRRLDNELEVIVNEIKKQAPIQKEIRTLTESLEKKKRKNKALKSIEVSKKRWIEIFEDLSVTLPNNMWISSLIQSDGKNNQVTLKGITYNFSEISQYMLSLEQQRSFKELHLVSIVTIQVEGNTAYQFDINSTLSEGME